jgi:hypothetical protein
MGGGSRELYTGINTLVAAFVKGMTAAGGQVAQTPAGGGGRYTIGDTGPGGGTVFHVEGSGGVEVSRLLGEEHTWNDAVKAARAYRGGGKDDWYLPTKRELNLIYENLHKAGKLNMGSDCYWSSSEGRTSDRAWYQYFSDGRQANYYKSDTGSVRAVRAF